MDLPAAGFDWDLGNLEKCRRHGVSIDDVEGMFRRLLWVTPDPTHSTGEPRFRAIGTDGKGRHIFVAFTMRERDGGMMIPDRRTLHAQEGSSPL